jgi:hypothetical protein
MNFESIDSARKTASNSKLLYERYQHHLPMKDILNRNQKLGVRSFLQLQMLDTQDRQSFERNLELDTDKARLEQA